MPRYAISGLGRLGEEPGYSAAAGNVTPAPVTTIIQQIAPPEDKPLDLTLPGLTKELGKSYTQRAILGGFLGAMAGVFARWLFEKRKAKQPYDASVGGK